MDGVIPVLSVTSVCISSSAEMDEPEGGRVLELLLHLDALGKEAESGSSYLKCALIDHS